MPATSSALTPTNSPTPLTPTPNPPPSVTPTPLPCVEGGGQIETGQLTTDLLRDPLDFRIYLPPCYGQEIERHYPVLYLIHGQGSTDDQWERLGAGRVADALIASGEAPPFLIVMPRDREWTEPSEDHFGQAVVEVLLPWVDEHYRTIPERQFRAVGGLSRGGAWALHFGLRYWEVFGAFGMHSGFAFYSDVTYINKWLDEIPPEQMPRIYMDICDNDRPQIAESAIWFEDILTQRGISHEWHMFAGYHEETYWQAHVEDYLRWYVEGWK
jgi:enterochelin esterase-like enzyme